MGKYDSSLTRVQPIFGTLLERDPTGASWISKILSSAPAGKNIGAAASREPGTFTEHVQSRFEFPAPPSRRFLEWLIRHPERMTWPRKKGQEVTFRRSTQDRREELFGRHGEGESEAARAAALQALALAGAAGSAGRWWAFEGFTKVDFCIQTETAIIFVEGKRTEALTKSTDWFPKRNQLVRNLEVVGELAGGRVAGVILGVEEPLAELDDITVTDSTPHLGQGERQALRKLYLGQVRWRDLCATCDIDFETLPDTV
ncbi:MAG: hypothetical protein WKF94_11945 [Solirubrobacteraceae bacterium]